MGTFILYKTILASGILILSLMVAMYSTLIERKIAGFFQDRLGPDRAGPWGLFQPMADGIKLHRRSMRWVFPIPGTPADWKTVLGTTSTSGT